MILYKTLSLIVLPDSLAGGTRLSGRRARDKEHLAHVHTQSPCRRDAKARVSATRSATEA